MKPFKRTGLHRVTCDTCGLAVYMTVAQLERGEMPETCWKCGGRFYPENLDLAYTVLAWDDFTRHPDYAEYAREIQSIGHGQASHLQRGRQVQSDTLLASRRVEEARKRDARERRLSGLRQYMQTTTAQEMPF